MQLIINILFWFALWWIIFGYFHLFLRKNGVGFKENYISTSLYFLFASLLAIFVFNYEIGLILNKFTPLGILLLILFFIAQYFIYSNLNRKTLNIELDKTQLFPISYKFFISKSFEITFQVLMEAALIALLFSNGIHPLKGTILFSFIFGIAHLPLLIMSLKNLVIKIFLTSSFIFSGFLALLILRFSFGLILLYIIHWSFYLSFALLVAYNQWVRELVTET